MGKNWKTLSPEHGMRESTGLKISRNANFPAGPYDALESA
jgi:hypothetical protein